jgi:hypothetical protein
MTDRLAPPEDFQKAIDQLRRSVGTDSETYQSAYAKWKMLIESKALPTEDIASALAAFSSLQTAVQYAALINVNATTNIQEVVLEIARDATNNRLTHQNLATALTYICEVVKVTENLAFQFGAPINNFRQALTELGSGTNVPNP